MTEVVHNMEQCYPKENHTCNRCLALWPNVYCLQNETDIFRIEENAEELLNSACETCQILGMALEVYQEEDSSILRPLLRWKRWSRHSGEAVLCDPDISWKGTWRENGTVKVWHPDSSSGHDWKGVEAGDHRVDFDAIRAWLAECSQAHVRCRPSIQEQPCNLKVIDCLERAITVAPARCRYVALSYVWGGVVIKTDTGSGLPSELPRTIEDSIKATLLLGYQYLWVDALCIDQDDADDQDHQIRHMDSIYTLAELTLIAAAGDDSSSGLPGVSKKRRLRYQDARVGDIYVSYLPQTVHRSITRSRWFTRGWTFQEGYLPPRRLYFTETAVLFVCNQSQEYEGFQRCIAKSDARLLEGTLNPHALGAIGDESSGPIGIMRSLKKYSARKLSHDSDALYAILGVLKYHRAKDQSIGIMWDIPYRIASAEHRFICIVWRHPSIAIRRGNYPSWSTLGWSGSVQFTDVHHQFELSVQDADSLSDHFRAGVENGHLSENSRYLGITVKVYRFLVVNLVRPRLLRTLHLGLSEQETPYLALPVGSATGNGDKFKFYLRLHWDMAPPDNCDGTEVTCAITHDQDLNHLSMMVLQDHGTHYERIGCATANPSYYGRMIMKGAGFDDITSTTKTIQTLSATDSPDFYWRHLEGGVEEDLAWIRDAEPVTITLG